MVRVLAVAVLMCVACRKPEAAPAELAPDAGQMAQAEVPDAGFVLTVAMLDAYLKYQAGTSAPMDGGLLDRARRDEAVRMQTGLSDAQVASIDRMVSAVMARRMVTQLAEHNAMLPDLAAMGQNLNEEQKKRMREAMNAFKSAQQAAGELKDERASFGSANVDVLLTREAELRAHWEALMMRMATQRPQ